MKVPVRNDKAECAVCEIPPIPGTDKPNKPCKYCAFDLSGRTPIAKILRGLASGKPLHLPEMDPPIPSPEKVREQIAGELHNFAILLQQDQLSPDQLRMFAHFLDGQG